MNFSLTLALLAGPSPDKFTLRLRESALNGLRLSLPRLLLENPLNNAGADAELSADLEDAITVSPQLQYFRLHRGSMPSRSVSDRPSRPAINAAPFPPFSSSGPSRSRSLSVCGCLLEHPCRGCRTLD